MPLLSDVLVVAVDSQLVDVLELGVLALVVVFDSQLVEEIAGGVASR